MRVLLRLRHVVDMALGGDQAGSIRIPASNCGTYGMKGTFGLVPYTGACSLETTIDHCGPITSTVADNALLLEVLAGPDGLDSRQNGVKTSRYAKALENDVRGLRIGVVKEGFDHHNSEPDVDAKVRAGADRLARLGAEVVEISVPMQRMTSAIWIPIGHDGGFMTLMAMNGAGVKPRGALQHGPAGRRSGLARAPTNSLTPSRSSRCEPDRSSGQRTYTTQRDTIPRSEMFRSI